MKKPDGLRRLLLAWVPALGDNPDALTLFVDRGRVAMRATGTLAFEYRYTLNIVVQDFAGDVTSIIVPLLAWAAEQQPDLLDKPEPFTFNRELLDGDLSDVSIDIDLTERVAVASAEGGGFAVNFLDEPAPVDEFPGVCGARLWQLFLRDQLVAQTSDPAFQG